ncbi:MAG TPA: FapA family protein, partial [Spirochaetia bacterium]|nr:FapA family protein [Spirochaetia bacterium]
PGLNTRLSPDGGKLFAECNGNVRIADGKILVEPVITVRNVNYETGNIHFEGSVVIEGSIADGFVVEANGDIQVGNGVGKATLKAGGNILLKTGINGNSEGTIDCGGDLFAKYIESCTVACRGNVLVEEAIMHSRVTAFKHCVLNGRRSEVIASELIVGGSFWCKKLGNFNEASTRLSVGVEPGLLLTYRTTMGNIEKKQEEWNRCEEQLEKIEKIVQDGRTDDRVLAARNQLHSSLDQLSIEISDLRARVPGLRDRLSASRKSIVVVEEMMYKGAVVVFGNLEYRVPDAGVRKTILKAGEHGILESGFNYHKRPKLIFDLEEAAPLEPV